MFILTVSAIIIAIICLGLSIIIFWKSRNKKESLFFCLFIFFTGLWILSTFFCDISTNANDLVLWTKIASILGVSGFPVLLIFLQIFIYHKSNILLKSILYFLPCVCISFYIIILPSDKIYSNLVDNIYFYNKTPAQGNLGHFYIYLTALFLLYYFIMFLTVYGGYKHAFAHKKNQIKYIALGSFLIISSGLIFDLILPIFGYIKLYNLGPQLSIIAIAFIGYAIFRHNLLDIKIVIQKGLIYVALLSIIVSVYLFVVFVLGYFLQEITKVAIIISAMITTIAGIFGVPPIDKFFRRVTDRIFFKDKCDYSEAIKILSETLNKNVKLEVIIQKIHEDLQSILKISWVKTLLPKRELIFDGKKSVQSAREFLSVDTLKFFSEFNSPVVTCSDVTHDPKNNKELQKHRLALRQAACLGKKYKTDIIVAVALEKELIGLIFLGPKLSGDVYTEEDKKLLETFSYQAAVAIKKAELYEQVIKHSEDLENRVKQRTAEIRELQEDQKQMILEISHGLQSPLTVLKGESEFLQKQITDSEFKTFEKAIDRISKFIYDLLLLAKLEAKNNDFKKKSINLSNLLKEMIDYHAVSAKDKNIQMVNMIEPKVFIIGDKEKIEELIINLITNAIKYIGNGNKISISLNKSKKLIISDNGMGIDSKDLPNIFRYFYRAKNGTGLKGTGLGLPICKKIVDLHGGAIKVESKIGVGTKFIIQFPKS